MTASPSPSPSGVRFAPSPTGRFHVGNLRTAWVSERWARGLGEPWVVRFEDIDVPRVVAGARERQLADLAALGLVPDRVELQSAWRERHFELFGRAEREGVVYACTCSRKEVQDALAGIASAPHGESPIYSGHCRNLPLDHSRRPGAGGVAWRFRSAVDESGTRDFIVARTATLIGDAASFVPAYHWACAIDDFDENHRLLVRAWDLAESTDIQREIQSWLAVVERRPPIFPAVFHTSLVTRNDGHRLEKRTEGVTLDELRAAGRAPAEIVALFVGSFSDSTSTLEPGRVFGEARRERTLAELGF